MAELTIKTNKQKRFVIYYWELTESQKEDLCSYDGIEESSFFVYRGQVYDINDYMRLDKNSPFGDFWQGYASDSFFSGTLVHLCEDDSESVIVGTYYS